MATRAAIAGSGDDLPRDNAGGARGTSLSMGEG